MKIIIATLIFGTLGSAALAQAPMLPNTTNTVLPPSITVLTDDVPMRTESYVYVRSQPYGMSQEEFGKFIEEHVKNALGTAQIKRSQ